MPEMLVHCRTPAGLRRSALPRPLPRLHSLRLSRRVLLVSLAVLHLAFLAAPAALAQGVVVRGAVVEPGERPVAGAVVELVPMLSDLEARQLLVEGRFLPEPVDGDRSGPDGRFQVEAPGPGMWQVLVRPSGGTGPQVPMVQSLEPLMDGVVLPSLVRRDGRRLDVTVLDAAGRSAPGVLVSLEEGAGGHWWPWIQQGWRPVPRRAYTDEGGRASLLLAAGESAHLAAWAAGSPVAAETQVGPEAETVTLRLAAPGPAERTVEARYPDGSPAPDVLVLLGRSPRPVGSTGDDGLLRLAGLPPGDWPIHLQGPAGWEVAGELTVPALPDGQDREEAAAGDEAPVPFTLLPPYDVAGRVVDAATRDPLADALAWSSDAPALAVLTDGDGGFRMLLPEPDEDGELGEVLAVAPGYRAGRRLPSGTLEMLFELVPQPLLQGRVVDPDGEPVADARVRVRVHDDMQPPWRASDELPGAWTGAGGRFRLPGVEPERLYDVRVETEGYAPVELTLAPPADELVQLSLDGAVRGTLTDAYGGPVAGVAVRLFEPPGPEGLFLYLVDDVRRSDLEAVSGADGSFRIAGVPPGTWELEAVAQGWVPVDRTGLEVEPATVLDLGSLVLEPAAEVEGRVVDGEGEPVPGVRVLLSPTSRFANRRVSRTSSHTGSGERFKVVTDDEGRFRLPALGASDPVTVLFRHPAHPNHDVHGVTPDGPPLEVVLPSAARLWGRVVGPDGAPVPRAQVELLMETEVQTSGGTHRSMSIYREQTDADGVFESDALPPGQVTVEVPAGELPGGRAGPVEIVAGQEVGPVEITLGEPRVVEGRVLAPDGTVAAGAEVRAETPFGTSRATTDAEGLYRIENVEAGPVTVHAERGAARATVETVVRGPVEVVDLVLEERTVLAGRVVTGGGEPVRAPRVEVARREGEAWRGDVDVEILPGGRFQVAEPVPGLYRILARDGGLRGDVEVTVSGDPPPGDVVVVLEPAARVVGRVLGAEDLLDAGLTVLATRDGVRGVGRVDATGRYQVRGLGPGEWRLDLQDSSGPLLTETVEILRPGETVDLDLDLDRADTGASLGGRVLLSGRPLAAGGVRLIPLEAGGRTRWTTTTHDGRYHFARLAPGPYRVQVTGRFAAPVAVTEVDLDGSETLDLDLRGAAVRGRVVSAQGDPVAGARVLLGAPGGIGGPMDTVVETGADGRFEVALVVEGEYRLEATAGGRRADMGPLRLGEADVEGLELVLPE